MADEIDRASQEVDSYLANVIRNSSKKVNPLTPNGYCYNCDEEVAHPKLFCNGVCASEHHRLSSRTR